MLTSLRFEVAIVAFIALQLLTQTSDAQITTVAADPALGFWAMNGVSQLVTCIHNYLVPGSTTTAPGLRPKLICVERPHGGGQGKYPPNPYTEPDNSRSNTAEIDLLASPGTATSVYAKISKSVNNPFCGGHAQMADGNIFHTGGDRESYINPLTNVAILTDGTNINRIYSPYDNNASVTNPWSTAGTAMAQGRWYPSVLTLSDGSQLIVGGVSVALSLNEYKAGKRTLNPTYEFYPSKGTAVNLPILTQNDPWNLYPFLNTMPISGKVWVFVGGPSILLDTKTGITTALANMKDILHHPRIYPFTPTLAMLPLRPSNNYTATMIVCGGTLRDAGVTNTTVSSTGTASNYCSKINPEATIPVWTDNFIQWPGSGKVMPDVVLMPDGNLLYVNGATWGTAGGDAGVCSNAHDPSFQTFIFNPLLSTFARGPDFTVARLYHSGAILIPDGRIITTGSEEANYVDFPKILTNRCFPFNGTGSSNWTSTNNVASASCTQPFEYRIEVFTPAYYSLPSKPVINEAWGVSYPKAITYGSNFIIRMDTNASNVASVSFIRYTTTTHSTNNDQRFVELSISYANYTHLYVEAPPNANVAPLGNWMLFPVAMNGAVGHSITIKMAAGAVSRVTVPQVTLTLKTGKKNAAKSLKPLNGVMPGLLLLIFRLLM
ncbi:hypothetical protein HK096_003672 [Nowakowskiella sp. JEL0078]|nr:hypothetical protein HK096_003672 [Nowakowskiella sp. JEL0078]